MVSNQILTIQNLTKNFSKFVAVENLSLEISENSCVGFLGPNGAGKTTTLKILTGLLKPTSGKAFINGYDVVTDFREAISKVGAVIETPEFYPHFSPSDILSYFGKLRGIPKQKLKTRIQEVLEEVNMTEWSDKSVGKFSKGMKQRIAIASALLHEPELVLLDEPVSGLDPQGMIEIREIIKSMKEQGKTIFMSSHLLGETQAICDEVALIDRGKLLGIKSIYDLNTQTNSKIKIEFLNEVSDSQISEIQQFENIERISKELSNVIEIEFVGDKTQRARLFKFLQEKNFDVISFSLIDSGLESLYREMISDSVR